MHISVLTTRKLYYGCFFLIAFYYYYSCLYCFSVDHLLLFHFSLCWCKTINVLTEGLRNDYSNLFYTLKNKSPAFTCILILF